MLSLWLALGPFNKLNFREYRSVLPGAMSDESHFGRPIVSNCVKLDHRANACLTPRPTATLTTRPEREIIDRQPHHHSSSLWPGTVKPTCVNDLLDLPRALSAMQPPDPPYPGLSQPSPPVPSNAVARRATLANVISVMRIDWVREYLLDLPPAAEASILASPLQRLHSITWAAEMRFCGMTTGAEPLDASHSTSIMIPTFSRDGLTAFTRIEENRGKTPTPFMSNGFSHGRFVMSEHDGAIVFAGQDDNESGRMTIFAKQNPNGREQVMQAFVFDKARLRTLAARSSAGVVEFEHALIAALFLHNAGPCKVCGGPAHGVCDCTLSFTRAQHSLDLSNASRNIAKALGTYDGFGLLEIFDRGQVESVTALSNSWNGVHEASCGVSNRLLSWAITQNLAASVPSVFRPLQLPDALAAATETDVADPAEASTMLLDDVDPALASFDFPDFPETPLDETPAMQQMNHVPGVTEPQECIMPLRPIGFSEIPRQVVAAPVLSNASEAEVIQTTYEHGQSVGSTSFPSLYPRSQAIPIAPLVPQGNVRGTAATAMTDVEMKQLRAHQQRIRNRESAARSNVARKKRKEMLKQQQAEKNGGVGHEELREAVHS